jgi:hypothetical protein
MRRNRLIMVFASVLALILFLILSFRVGGQIYRNQRYIKNFSYKDETGQYKKLIPMNQMDLSLYDYLLEIPQTPVGKKVDNTIVLPINIQYFTEQNGPRSMILEIKKGTRVLWLPTDQLGDISFGYGLRSYPTYDGGWRYVKPFMALGNQADSKKLPYYYVRTADLEVITKQVINSNEYLASSIKEQGVTINNAVFAYTRVIDSIFYDNGVFCSLDLLKQVWHWGDTVLLSLAIGVLLIAWLLKRQISITKLPFLLLKAGRPTG